MTALFKPGAPIRVGTRASALAVAQTSAVAAQLGAFELVTITSEGDRSSAPLASLGGTGVFVSALRDALLAGEVDLIVHSFKDLPTGPAEGIALAAVPERADARDALATRDGVTLARLAPGARVGTGSPRRRAQLLAARPDLEVVGIRGNVDSRLGRLYDADDDRRVDGLVLAAAGLERIGRLGEASELLDLGSWPTAPAQGALALETREDAGSALLERVAAVDHPPTRLTATAERGVLARLEAGCSAPSGAHATIKGRAEGDVLTLTATVYAPDGTSELTVSDAEVLSGGVGDIGRQALELADRVSAALLDRGAARLAPLGGTR
jgi:hydroxymethylbilane synthase